MTDIAVNPDQLGESVTRHLSRSYRNWFSSSPLRCGVLGVLTLGVWPLLRLRKQFRNYVAFEQQQLWYLAQWMRQRSGGDEATVFADATKRLTYRWTLQWVQTWCLIGIVAVMLSYAPGQNLLGEVIDRTFGFEHLPGWVQSIDSVSIPFFVWNLGLAIAYGFHWWQVRRHARRARWVVGRFDAVAERELGAAAFAKPQVSGGSVGLPDFKWGAMALIMAGLGAVWAIPMALAGAAQRRYINVTAASRRADLLTRVRAIQARVRPAGNFPNYAIHGRLCENGLCRANLPGGARFCPRCGNRLAMSEVA